MHQQGYIAWRLNPPFTDGVTAMYGSVQNNKKKNALGSVEWLLVCVLPFTEMQANICIIQIVTLIP